MNNIFRLKSVTVSYDDQYVTQFHFLKMYNSNLKVQQNQGQIILKVTFKLKQIILPPFPFQRRFEVT